MSSTLSHDGQPQRSWWQQKSPADKPHSHSKQSGIKFNALASAMGFRPKKSHPPALTIQDSPYPIISAPGVRLVPRTESQRRPYTAPSPVAVGRPPSNSVSSFRSRVDSIEPTTPKTPDDPAKARRGSLLTLSDADPFAARVVSLHSPSDPNRLSAFSNSSANDTKSNESVNRVSYASSSSHSYRMGGDLSPLSILSPASEAGSSYMRLSSKVSSHSLRRKDLSNDTWLPSLGETNRFSQPDPPPKPRPAMRARGMTDGGIERSNFLRNDPFVAKPVPSPDSSSASYHSASSPKMPSRQVSLSRPTPPPSHELPPPPPRSGDIGHSAGSASSSSLTFSADFMPSPRVKAKTSFEPPPRPVESGWEADVPSRSTPRTLRKSISHQSLTKRGQSSSSASSFTMPAPEPATVKAPRKQRSFHQHRLPVPAIPLQLPLSEQRVSDPALFTRKRLFSGSSARRPSQSTIPIADDARSVTTASEHERAPSSSCWIDTDQPPRSPMSAAHEYTPQQIMSPAEMLQVEASVNAEYQYQRPRKASIASTSMSMSDFEHEFGLSPSTSFGGGPSRSNSDHPSVRSSSTSDQTNLQDMFYHPMAPQPPSPPVLMSLPPPPRRIKPRAGSLSRSQSEIITPLSPPPRKNIRPKISVEERMHRQSLMRKPSFLDIEDEMDKDPTLMRQGSFLDLTRESFDSVRSVDSLDYN